MGNTPMPFRQQHSPFDEIMRPDERWSARDLQKLMGYREWRNLKPALDRAMISARVQGLDVETEFSQVAQLVGSRNLGDQERVDYLLTRQAAYLLAMNGDPNKSEIAAAQGYFVMRTRQAEQMLSGDLDKIREQLDEAVKWESITSEIAEDLRQDWMLEQERNRRWSERERCMSALALHLLDILGRRHSRVN